MRIGRTLTFLAIEFLMIASTVNAAAPTFSKDVAPILFKNCSKCHRPGEIASAVPLLSYEGVRPWAKSIKEKILQREMPPWPADPKASLKFRNDARLSQQDIDTLVAWVNAGGPKGDDADLPPKPEFPQGWLHPKGIEPDAVISLPGEVQLPAKGVIPYLRYLVKVPFSEDQWVAASQLLPGNRAVVHHMAITEVALNDGVTPADVDRFALAARQMGLPNGLIASRAAVPIPGNPATFDMLGIYTPGTTFEMCEEGSAKLLKGGQNFYFNFNIHYQATGKPEKDRSTMALWFLPGPPKHQVFRVSASGETIIAAGKELLTDTPGKRAEGARMAIPPIPPQADNYEVIAITAYPEPVTIYQFQPHAHLRGKDFKYAVVYPDGREEVVLSVPKYDFNWQLAYELDTPLKLPAGSKLIVTAHYDNSPNNLHNPDPNKEVYFREENQSWDEMFTPFLQYSIDNQDLTKPPPTSRTNHDGGNLDVVEAVGCLEKSSSGTWLLKRATDPAVSTVQATSAVAVKAAGAQPMGDRQYGLLGLEVFHPSSHQGQRVAVKGVRIAGHNETRLNVTSVQMTAPKCLP